MALLPYVEQGPLYNSIDQTQAWDSPRNSPFNASAPRVYRCPESDASANPGQTDYLAVTGPETVFPGGNTKVSYSTINDGSSNTILIVEATGQNINWMAPKDLSFSQVQFSQLQSGHSGGLNVVLCDGSVRFLRHDEMDDRTFKAMLTRNGGEIVSY